MTELKPCMYCGEVPKLILEDSCSYVICNNCRLHAAVCDWMNSKEMAIDYWNSVYGRKEDGRSDDVSRNSR